MGDTSAAGLLGPLEYEVMQALWAGSPVPVPAVLEVVNEQRSTDGALAYTTVMTVLSRLYDKGLVVRDRRGRGFEYTPRFSETGLVAHLSEREVQGLLERYGEVALAHFAAAVDRADERLLARLRSHAGERLRCSGHR